jgi:hypothetical protein
MHGAYLTSAFSSRAVHTAGEGVENHYSSVLDVSVIVTENNCKRNY